MITQLNIDFEEWRPIEGYEGLYELRNDGLLYNIRKKEYSYGWKNGWDYLQLSLSKNGKRKTPLANRLVWEVFVGPIPKGYDVHHKNEIKTDNRVENLELISSSEHTRLHNEEKNEKCIKAMQKASSKPVLQFSKEGVFVAKYESGTEAFKKTGISQTLISRCCLGKAFTAGGYKWKFAA